LVHIQGLLRSVIINRENRVVGFAPPKSYSFESFVKKYPLYNTSHTIVGEEFIEGTMINVFWDYTIGLSGAWEIATRNTIGGDGTFFNSTSPIPSPNLSFRSMFLEAATYNNLNLNYLTPGFSYSFVLQHPNNRTISYFSHPQLYLVEVYQCYEDADHNALVYPINLEIIKPWAITIGSTIKFPTIYYSSDAVDFTYECARAKYASMNTPYNVMGVVFRNIVTNDRTKLRNPAYEYVRQMLNIQPKFQYQYLCLRKEKCIDAFLSFYPDKCKQFSFFSDSLHTFTETLYQNYISCYIHKKGTLPDFSEQFRPHMFKIHQNYKKNLKPIGKHVTMASVINYVNKLSSQLQMYNLNFLLRKRSADFSSSR
jgi:hypothetical protein